MSTLVVGGYGSVGQVVCRELLTSPDVSGSVRVAGRDGREAAALAARLGGEASGVAFDVADQGSFDLALADVDRVVVCVDQADTAFAEACLERGIDYVDVTASDEFLQEIEALDDIATSAGATAMLSVGLSPGLTNVMAARAARDLDRVASIEIGVLLGLGEAFGPAASRWTLERIGREFPVAVDGEPRTVRGFSDPKRVDFPEFGRRVAYRFDLADQHALARTMDVGSVATRLCFDSRLVTAAAHELSRVGWYQHLLDIVGIDRAVRLVESIDFGSDRFAITVEARGDDGEEERWLLTSLVGREQSKATGIVAAYATDLISGDVPPGVHHSHELIDPYPLFDRLRSRDYLLQDTQPSRGVTFGGSSGR